MRKIYIRCLIAAAGLATAPLASASALGDNVRDAQEIIQLVAKQTQSQSLDLGEKGLGLGDERIIAEDLYQGGKKIGDHSVVCVYVHIDPSQLQCVGTFALPRGQIAGQALLHLPPAPAIDIPITGGAGAYRTAHGYVHTVPAGETERRLTFHISH
ncbi:hypothetical protein [Nonomuraea sp. NPDC049158]|uniref:allene oxide cyclase barrel-like domain-containing protein n=1 Tax=Nonomuraea sp. NPDC049158 TaxID=3155649 RepID=UPI0033D2ACBD